MRFDLMTTPRFSLATYAAAMTFSTTSATTHDYNAVFSKERDVGIKFEDLPGFTRSAFERDHALITPESRVWSGTPGWKKSNTAHLVTPNFPMGAEFTMYLADMKAGGVFESNEKEQEHLERFVFVVEGKVSVACADGPLELKDDDFVFFPPGYHHKIVNLDHAKLVVYERQHFYATPVVPAFHHGSTSEKSVSSSPRLPIAPHPWLRSLTLSFSLSPTGFLSLTDSILLARPLPPPPARAEPGHTGRDLQAEKVPSRGGGLRLQHSHHGL